MRLDCVTRDEKQNHVYQSILTQLYIAFALYMVSHMTNSCTKKKKQIAKNKFRFISFQTHNNNKYIRETKKW